MVVGGICHFLLEAFRFLLSTHYRTAESQYDLFNGQRPYWTTGSRFGSRGHLDSSFDTHSPREIGDGHSGEEHERICYFLVGRN